MTMNMTMTMMMMILMMMMMMDDDDDDDDDDEHDNFYGAITQHISLQGQLDKSRVTCQRYALSKLCDLILDLDESRVDAERMDVGMVFQNFGLVTEKARSPKR